MIDPRLLDHGHVFGWSEAFNRGDVAPNIGQSNLERPDCFTIDMYRAGATCGYAAAEFRARQAQPVAQGPQQGHVVGQVNRFAFAVDRQGGGQKRGVSFGLGRCGQARSNCGLRQSATIRNRSGMIALNLKNPAVAAGQPVWSICRM